MAWLVLYPTKLQNYFATKKIRILQLKRLQPFWILQPMTSLLQKSLILLLQKNVKKWSESAKIWEELASSTTSSTEGISADYTNKGIYQFSISDQTGNSTYYHFKTLEDTAKPSFNEGYPKVKATKGIFGIKDDVLYYNEMEIQVSGQGIGIIQKVVG